MGTAGARLPEDLQPRMRYGSKKPLEDQQIGERLAGVKAANAPLVEQRLEFAVRYGLDLRVAGPESGHP